MKPIYERYVLSDIRISELSPAAQIARDSGKLEFSLQNAEALTFANNSIDRTIFACVLHHLGDPEIALIESRRVTKNGGLISIYLPCDPGFVYRHLRRFFTYKVSKKLGIDYELMNVREHTNHYYQLNKLIKTVFRNDDIKVTHFPIQFFSYDFNIYSVYHVTIRD